MKKSRYTEEKVAYTLRLAESARRSPMSAVKWALPRRRSTCGRRNTAAWEPPRCGNCVRCETKITGPSVWVKRGQDNELIDENIIKEAEV